MRSTILILFSLMALLGIGAVVTLLSQHRIKREPRIYAGGLETVLYVKWAKDFRATCPHMALVAQDQDADYQINATWSNSRWHAFVIRNDTANIYEAENPNYVQILREACNVIRTDLEDWTLPAISSPELKKAGEAGTKPKAFRFELHDVRNGNTVTSAIFDKQTGRVWCGPTSPIKTGRLLPRLLKPKCL